MPTSSELQNKAPLHALNHVPISQMKPNQIIALQRQVGNQFALNMINKQPGRNSHSIQRASQNPSKTNRIQRAPTVGSEDPAEFEVKRQEEHDKQATPDIENTQYVVTGDTVIFLPLFGGAIITPIPAQVSGTGTATIDRRNVAVEGDEQKIIATGVS